MAMKAVATQSDGYPRVVLRTEMGPNKAVLAQISNGTVLNVVSQQDGYVCLKYNNELGFAKETNFIIGRNPRLDLPPPIGRAVARQKDGHNEVALYNQQINGTMVNKIANDTEVEVVQYIIGDENIKVRIESTEFWAKTNNFVNIEVSIPEPTPAPAPAPVLPSASAPRAGGQKSRSELRAANAEPAGQQSRSEQRAANAEPAGPGAPVEGAAQTPTAFAQQKDGFPDVAFRASPDTKVIGKVPNGEPVEYIQEQNGQLNFRWDGKEGWARVDNFQIQHPTNQTLSHEAPAQSESGGSQQTHQPEAEAAVPQAVAQQKDGFPDVAFRDKVGGAVIGKVPNGAAVDYIQEEGGQLNFCYDGREGWARADNFQITRPTDGYSQPQHSQSSSVRTPIIVQQKDGFPDVAWRASKDGKVVGKISNGEEVVYVQEQAGWLNFSWDGKDCWAKSENFRGIQGQQVPMQSAAPATPSSAVAQQKDGFPDVAFRAEPGNGKVLGKVPNGECVEYLQEQNGQLNFRWNGQEGWARSDNFQF